MTARAARIRKAVGRLTIVQWSLFHWYASFGVVWGILLIAVPPTGPALALGGLLSVVAVLVIVGAVVSGIGAFMGAQPRTAGNVGLIVEAIGLGFLQAGNVSYLMTQIALATAPVLGRDRITVVAYVWATSAALFVRGLFLVRNYVHVGEPVSRKVIH